MKTIIVTFIAAWVSASAIADGGALLFRSIFDIDGKPIFFVSDPDREKSAWVSAGDVFDGFEILEFIEEERILVVSRDATKVRLPLARTAPCNFPMEIGPASTLEEIFRAVEGLPPEAKLDLILRNTTSEM